MLNLLREAFAFSMVRFLAKCEHLTAGSGHGTVACPSLNDNGHLISSSSRSILSALDNATPELALVTYACRDMEFGNQHV